MFLSFIFTCLIIELTPGPNMAYLAILSASHGRRAGFAAVLGVALGLGVVGLAAALGIAAAIANSPFAYQALRWLGVIYLLGLAWSGWKEGQETSAGIVEENIPHARFFRNGLITNLLNPKAAIFYIAILPTFIVAPVDILTQTITFTLIYVAIASLVHCAVVMTASYANSIFKETRDILIVRRVLSLLLAAVALWFAVSTGENALGG